jgi:hypothetical protein
MSRIGSTAGGTSSVGSASTAGIDRILRRMPSLVGRTLRSAQCVPSGLVPEAMTEASNPNPSEPVPRHWAW